MGSPDCTWTLATQVQEKAWAESGCKGNGKTNTASIKIVEKRPCLSGGVLFRKEPKDPRRGALCATSLEEFRRIRKYLPFLFHCQSPPDLHPHFGSAFGHPSTSSFLKKSCNISHPTSSSHLGTLQNLQYKNSGNRIARLLLSFSVLFATTFPMKVTAGILQTQSANSGTFLWYKEPSPDAEGCSLASVEGFSHQRKVLSLEEWI